MIDPAHHRKILFWSSRFTHEHGEGSSRGGRLQRAPLHGPCSGSRHETSSSAQYHNLPNGFDVADLYQTKKVSPPARTTATHIVADSLTSAASLGSENRAGNGRPSEFQCHADIWSIPPDRRFPLQ